MVPLRAARGVDAELPALFGVWYAIIQSILAIAGLGKLAVKLWGQASRKRLIIEIGWHR
jgi:hypothetical protein